MIFELSNKIKGILAKYYSYFLGRLYFTSNDGSQMMFVYQTTFTTNKYHNTRTEYIISWRSKGLYTTKLAPINTDILHNIVYFNRKIALKLNSTPLILDRNSYIAKIVNVCIVCDLDYWRKDPVRSFTQKGCLFGETNTVKNSDREKFV